MILESVMALGDGIRVALLTFISRCLFSFGGSLFAEGHLRASLTCIE
jgi:hypothetical protein